MFEVHPTHTTHLFLLYCYHYEDVLFCFIVVSFFSFSFPIDSSSPSLLLCLFSFCFFLLCNFYCRIYLLFLMLILTRNYGGMCSACVSAEDVGVFSVSFLFRRSRFSIMFGKRESNTKSSRAWSHSNIVLYSKMKYF